MLSKITTECGISEIIPSRSQGIPLALLQPPYRTFLSTSDSDSTKSSTLSLLLYCLPTSETEYVTFSSEAESMRSLILSGDSSTVVVSYDVAQDAIVGGTVEDVIGALSGDADKQASLAAASLRVAQAHA